MKNIRLGKGSKLENDHKRVFILITLKMMQQVCNEQNKLIPTHIIIVNHIHLKINLYKAYCKTLMLPLKENLKLVETTSIKKFHPKNQISKNE